MPQSTELNAHIQRLSEARVACAGDVMLDRFIYGEVDRISPEAPVPVLRIERETEMLGGIGNVARNLSALGAHCTLTAMVGDDSAGHQVQELLQGLGRCTQQLVVEHDRCTTIKTRCIGAHQQILRVDRERIDEISVPTRESLLAHVKQALLDHRVLALSDYGKGVLTQSLVAELIAVARAVGCPVVVDPKGKDFTLYRGATIVTPNRSELARATGLTVVNDAEVVLAARSLRDRCEFEAVVVTRSEDGLTVVGPGDAVNHLPAESREVYDVSGAGDTVVATLAAALAIDVPLPEAAQLANLAAGIAVSKLGTAVTEADELRALLHQREFMSIDAKLATSAQAVDTVSQWHEQGLSVGFTNGCFDLVHPGHVALLEKARNRCDRLIVGLNTDASVSGLKGPTRPVQNEIARATVLASMRSVDLVVLFSEDTPLRLIEALRPQVLFKGSDYTVDGVVGGKEVRDWGGRVELIDIVPEQSTSRIVHQLGGI